MMMTGDSSPGDVPIFSACCRKCVNHARQARSTCRAGRHIIDSGTARLAFHELDQISQLLLAAGLWW